MRYTARVFVIISRFKQKFITYVFHDIQENILPVAPFYPDINGGVIQIVTHSVCKQTFEMYCTCYVIHYAGQHSYHHDRCTVNTDRATISLILTVVKMGKRKYQNKWADNEKYKQWIGPASDPYRAYCKVCKKDFDVTSMGITAVRSHNDGLKHKANIARINKLQKILEVSFLNQPQDKVQLNPSILVMLRIPHSQLPVNYRPKTVTASHITVSKDQEWHAEVIWAMKVIYSHYSYITAVLT